MIPNEVLAGGILRNDTRDGPNYHRRGLDLARARRRRTGGARGAPDGVDAADPAAIAETAPGRESASASRSADVPAADRAGGEGAAIDRIWLAQDGPEGAQQPG